MLSFMSSTIGCDLGDRKSHVCCLNADAKVLARLGRADPELLAPINHRGTEVQADLAAAKVRDALVRTRTRLVSQARGLVKSFGERLPRCSAESFHRRARAEVPGL